MNAAQKKAWKMKLSEAAKLRWERKRKNLKKKEKTKGEKEGTWKAERTETNGIKFRYRPAVKQHEKMHEFSWRELKPYGMTHKFSITKEPITIEDIQQVKDMVSKIGKDTFLRLVEVVG